MRRLALPFLFLFSLAVVAIAPFMGMQNIAISDLLGGGDENLQGPTEGRSEKLLAFIGWFH